MQVRDLPSQPVPHPASPCDTVAAMDSCALTTIATLPPCAQEPAAHTFQKSENAKRSEPRLDNLYFRRQNSQIARSDAPDSCRAIVKFPNKPNLGKIPRQLSAGSVVRFQQSSAQADGSVVRVKRLSPQRQGFSSLLIPALRAHRNPQNILLTWRPAPRCCKNCMHSAAVISYRSPERL